MTQLQRCIGRIERLLARGTATSSRFTRWRLAIFVVGLVTSITLFKISWYNSGNLAIAGFVILFLIVAAYHNRLEERIHRLRVWKSIKSVHLARIQLDWSKIPTKPWEQASSHLYAQDLDLTGSHSLLHLVDYTVSDQGRGRLTSWLLTQPPDQKVWEARQRLVRELCPRSLFREDRK